MSQCEAITGSLTTLPDKFTSIVDQIRLWENSLVTLLFCPSVRTGIVEIEILYDEVLVFKERIDAAKLGGQVCDKSYAEACTKCPIAIRPNGVDFQREYGKVKTCVRPDQKLNSDMCAVVQPESFSAVVHPKQAPTDSKFFFTITVSMPYSKAEFDADKKSKYKIAVATAAGTIETNVDLVEIKEKRRRAGSIDVVTKVSNREAPQR